MAKKKIEAKIEDTLNGIKITSVQVYILKEAMGRTRAMARIVFNDAFQLTGLRVMDGANGLFVSYPNDPNYKGDDYRNLFYPVTNDLREHIEEEVLVKFQEMLAVG